MPKKLSTGHSDRRLASQILVVDFLQQAVKYFSGKEPLKPAVRR